MPATLNSAVYLQAHSDGYMFKDDKKFSYNLFEGDFWNDVWNAE